eukprot:COSAG06_NODE_859_length_11882_cov_31.614701_7_plen_158_part_00
MTRLLLGAVKRISALSSVGKDGEVQPIEDELWSREVERPTRKLALITLPTLSDGWGQSVGLVSVGWVSGGLSFYVEADSVGFLDPSTTPGWLLAMCCGMILGLIAVPALLVITPATASSSCARLEDRITRLCIEDPNHPNRGLFIKSLKADNKDQGL